ncbi:chromatin target of PRMT1 protein isoform X1 [Ostrinia furnacalis]|uniref:chromatin target of PRMT1 protein isoform X1 n=1 Tax=Ostrinia furnacalis TaxID=93504 RepID=UPI00103B75B2|nr:chromatin target of PRMT1 protein isoform X1 [Ostrinia furnacalis]
MSEWLTISCARSPPPARRPEPGAGGAQYSASSVRRRSLVSVERASVLCDSVTDSWRALYQCSVSVPTRRLQGAVCDSGLLPRPLGATDRRRDLEGQRGRRRGRSGRGVRHGVRRGGRRRRLPRARPAPRALAHGALAGQVRPARQLQRQGRGEGAPREVPDGEVRQPPDGADPQAPGRGDVALRRAAEALRGAGEQRRGGRGGRGRGGGGGRGRAAGHGRRRAAAPPPRDLTIRCQKTSKRCK